MKKAILPHLFAAVAIPNQARRQLLQRAVGLAAAAAIATPASAKSEHSQKMRLRLEGDVDFDWVLSLYTPPALAGGLPPGIVGRVRAQYPAPDASANPGQSRRIMAVSAFLAPAGVPPGVPAPELAPISVLEIAVEEVLLGMAAFADEATRPGRHVGILGRTVSNEVESPFGSLVNRVATTSFGFDWTGAGNAATFKLVAIGAAGSHITVLPEAAGEISFD